MRHPLLDTARGNSGLWMWWVIVPLVIVFVLVAHYFPALRDLFFGNFMAAAAYLSHAIGL